MRWQLVVPVLFIFKIPVLAHRSDILVETAKKSWLSPGNFASVLELSLNASLCCNVQIIGRSIMTENIFNEFAKIYPYEYSLSGRNLDCPGYLTISTTRIGAYHSMKNFPLAVSTTEILFIIDDDMDFSSRLLNSTMYHSSNVNIVTRNGFWTLAENYLHPRAFKKVSTISEMRHKKGIVDLQGRQLQVAAFYNPPYCYLKTATNKTINGVTEEVFLPKKDELDGVEVKTFLLIAEKLNFTWTIRKPHAGAKYGRRNGTSWEGGIIGQLFKKEVHMAFTGIWVKLDHYEMVRLSKAIASNHIHFLVPRPKPNPSFWALTRPFSPAVWYATFLLIIVQSAYVYVSAWTSSRIPLKYRSFVATSTEMLGRLVGVCMPHSNRSLELQLQLWHVIGILLVTAYSSSLAARLANPTYQKRIDTHEDFIRENLTWGREGPTPVLSEYFHYTDYRVTEFSRRFQREYSDQERHQKILKGKYAIIGQLVGSVFFPENHISREDLRGYRLMKEELGQFFTAFAAQPWLVGSISKVVSRLSEGGFMRHHLKDVIDRRASSALRELRIEHDGLDGHAKVLRLTPLGAGFALFGAGLVLATVTFCYELQSVRGSRSIPDVLHDIEENRAVWERKKRAERRKRNQGNILKSSSRRLIFSKMPKFG